MTSAEKPTVFEQIDEKISYWQERNSLHSMMFAKELTELKEKLLEFREQIKAKHLRVGDLFPSVAYTQYNQALDDVLKLLGEPKKQ